MIAKRDVAIALNWPVSFNREGNAPRVEGVPCIERAGRCPRG